MLKEVIFPELEIERTIRELKEFRSMANWGEADKLRDKLVKEGIEVSYERDGRISVFYRQDSRYQRKYL